MSKPKICVTPLIRRALEDIIEKANKRIINISEADRAYAIAMLDRLAEFASENAVDPKNEAADSLASSEAWLDQQWELIKDHWFDRIRKIALGDDFKESDFVMVRKVFSVLCVDMMVEMRSQLIDRTIR